MCDYEIDVTIQVEVTAYRAATPAGEFEPPTDAEIDFYLYTPGGELIKDQSIYDALREQVLKEHQEYLAECEV